MENNSFGNGRRRRKNKRQKIRAEQVTIEERSVSVRSPAKILDVLLKCIPVNTELKITKTELLMLGRLAHSPKGSFLREVAKSTLFRLNENDFSLLRHPEVVLSMLVALIPCGHSPWLTALEFERLRRVTGKSSWYIDLNDHKEAALKPEQRVAVGCGHITIPEAAQMLDVPHEIIGCAVERGEVRMRRVGNKSMVDAGSLRDYMLRNGKNVPRIS